VLPPITRSALAVGDQVRIRVIAAGEGVVEAVLASTGPAGLVRQAPDSDRAHVVAANVDQVVAILAAQQPPPDFTMLDRYLVIAEHYELPAIIVLNKLDLGVPLEVEAELAVYARLSYPVVRTSAVTGQGLGELTALLAGKRSVFSGVSGVGKSSLINRLKPEAHLQVGPVSETGEGRHTTTAAEIIAIDDGTLVTDTPGLRKLEMWDIAPEDLAGLFPEMRARSGKCRFRDCAHIAEPGCAIRAAVATGEIWPRRYASYCLFYRQLSKAAREG